MNPRDPEDLAQALDGLLKDSLKRKKFAEGGVQRIKQLFSLEVAIKETLKSYKKVLALAGN